MKKNRKKGFALVYTVIALAIIIGIFMNYSMSARARKVVIQKNKGTANQEESLSQAIGLGIADVYTMDKMIVKKQDSIYDQLGYFIVKDIPQGGVSQSETIKVWENVGNGNSGSWYSVEKENSGNKYTDKNGNDFYIGGTWKFTKKNLSQSVNASKGGYVIKTIKSIEGSNVRTLYDGGIYNYKGSSFSKNPIQDRLESYWGLSGQKALMPKFEIEMYKNMLYTLNPNSSGENVRDYDAIVKIELNYPPMEKMPNQDITNTDTKYKEIQSRYPIRMEEQSDPLTGNIDVEMPGTIGDSTTTITVSAGTPQVYEEVTILEKTNPVLKPIEKGANNSPQEKKLCQDYPKIVLGTAIGVTTESKIFPSVSTTSLNPNNNQCLYDSENGVYVCEIGGVTKYGTTEGQTTVTDRSQKNPVIITQTTPIVTAKIETKIASYPVTQIDCRVGSSTSATGTPAKNEKWWEWLSETKYTEKRKELKETAQKIGELRVATTEKDGNFISIPATSTSKIKSYEVYHIGP